MEWDLNAQQKVSIEPAFQKLTNSLYTSVHELGAHREDRAGTKEGPSEVFWKSLWNPFGKKNGQLVPSANDTLVVEFLEAFFAGRRRWTRDPRSIHRTRTKYELQDSRKWFNCEHVGCSLKMCGTPKNEIRIRKNRVEWRRRRNIAGVPVAANVASYIDKAQDDAELLEFCIAAAAVDIQSYSENLHSRNAENFLHATFMFVVAGVKEESNSAEYLSNILFASSHTHICKINESNYILDGLKKTFPTRDKPPTWDEGNFLISTIRI